MGRERLGAQGGVVRAAGFEAVDLPAQAGLAAIDAARVQKHRAAHLGERWPGLFSSTEAVISERTPQSKPSTRRSCASGGTFLVGTSRMRSSTATRRPSRVLISRRVGASGVAPCF